MNNKCKIICGTPDEINREIEQFEQDGWIVTNMSISSVSASVSNQTTVVLAVQLFKAILPQPKR